VSPPSKKHTDIDSASPCMACAPVYAKLQQQMSNLWNAHKKLVAEVTEIKRIAGNIQQTAVKSDEHVKLVAELSEMKTVVTCLSEEQHAGSASHDEELNLTAKVCKTVNDMNRRKKNIVVTGLPEVASDSDETETRRIDEAAFSTFCEENLTVKPAMSKLGCRRLGKANGSGTKPRRLLVHLTSEQNAQDLLSSAKAILRKSHDHYIASAVYFNPDLTAAEAKVAFEQRQRRREAKTAKLTGGETSGASAATSSSSTAVTTTASYQVAASTSTSTTVPVPISSNSYSLSAEAVSFTPVSVSDVTSDAQGLQPCV